MFVGCNKNKQSILSGGKQKSGFTLIELLVVISIIGLLSSVVLSSLVSAKVKARNAKRLSDMAQLIRVLELYYSEYGVYPNGDGDGCGTWDVGNQDYPFLTTGGVSRLGSLLPNPPVDPTATGNCSGYRYYRYAAGYAGCDPSKGAFYVIIATMEGGSSQAFPGSPGFACPDRNWQTDSIYIWVTGRFEN